MGILESTIRNVNGRYEVGLLWRENNLAIPNNRPIALQRLLSNKRRFKSDPDYAQKYSKIIDEYIQLGFARKLETNELEGPQGRTHHIVPFGVENPNKPGKLRVVFHASLEYKGTALNDLLSSGPDMLMNLTILLDWVGIRNAKHSKGEFTSICGLHFASECFKKGATKLEKTAVPTIFTCSVSIDIPHPVEKKRDRKHRMSMQFPLYCRTPLMFLLLITFTLQCLKVTARLHLNN